MVLRVAFYKGRGLLRDRLIRWWTNSEYSHVEIVLPNEKGWVGIYPPHSPVVSVDSSGRNLADWDFVDIPISEEMNKQINIFCEKTNGQKYDWIGMIISNVSKFKVRNINKWYCSEWVAYALSFSGILLGEKLSTFEENRITPQRLYEILVAYSAESSQWQRQLSARYTN